MLMMERQKIVRRESTCSGMVPLSASQGAVPPDTSAEIRKRNRRIGAEKEERKRKRRAAAGEAKAQRNSTAAI